MKKNNLVYLHHILNSIQQILEYNNGISDEAFYSNQLVKDATVRNYEIIGEATKRISADFKNKYDEVPWKNMAGMRDKLIHNYLEVDFEIVRYTTTTVLPKLKAKLEHIISNENS